MRFFQLFFINKKNILHVFSIALTTFPLSSYASLTLEELIPETTTFIHEEEKIKPHGSLCLPEKCYDPESCFSKKYPFTTAFNKRMCSILECCITGKDDPEIKKDYSISVDEEDRKIETRLTCLSCSIAATVTTIAIYFVGCFFTTSLESCKLCIGRKEDKIINYSPLPSNENFSDETL